MSRHAIVEKVDLCDPNAWPHTQCELFLQQDYTINICWICIPSLFLRSMLNMAKTVTNI